MDIKFNKMIADYKLINNLRASVNISADDKKELEKINDTLRSCIVEYLTNNLEQIISNGSI